MKKYRDRYLELALLALALSLVLTLPSASIAQAQQDQISLDQLRTPTSPGFVLLGIEPSSVERPSTPKALAVSLLSATQRGDLIPRDYAVEVAPYWLSSHPNLTFEQYANPDIGQSILQTLSLSLVTSRGSSGTDTTTGTRIGLGMRSLLSAGKANSRIADLRAKLLEIQNKILDAETEAEIKSLMEQAKEVALKMQAEDKQRVGWLIEYVGAILVDFPADNFDVGKITRWGLWATTTYRLEDPLVDFLGLVRIIRNDQAGRGENLFDIGGRVVWQQDRFALSAEFTERFGSSSGTEDQNTWRLNGNIEYRVTDDAYISASFGRNFQDDASRKGTLIAVVAVNLGFGEIPILGLK